MKKKVALLAGGFTGEYVISMQTADTIAEHLNRERYEVYKVIVSREGWFYQDADGHRSPVDKNDFSIRAEGVRIVFDVALIAIHGTPGEDGLMQGYLELLGVPYTTCDVATSAITMNKGYTKSVLAGTPGLFLASSAQLFRSDVSGLQGWRDRCAHLRLPLFVKPNNGGSSIGMSKVERWDDLQAALEKAFGEDRQVLVEEFVNGDEYSVGAFRAGGELEVLPATAIKPGRDFFDFEAKYSPGVAEEITPAPLSGALRSELAELVRRVYERLNCRGVVRMDFIHETGTGHWYFIEVNTVPGQAANSILPRQVRASGKSMTEFYSRIIEESLRSPE